jgi:hypothetical protein
MEGNAANADDPNHMRFLSTGVLVSDITLQDPISQETLTLDGIFGMNMLVASASFSSGPGGLPIIDAFQDGYFNWVVFDEPNGRLGFDLKEFVEPAPNEWSRSTSGNWDVDGNWSFGIVPAGTSETALLGKSLLSDGTVNLATTDVTLRGLRFNNDAASYTVTSTGGTLRFESASGPALIQLDSANTESHEIAAPIQIASDLNIDATLSTLTLSGSQRWDAGRTVAVRTGTVRFNLGAEDTVIVDGNNQLRIDDGAIVQLEGVKSPLAGGGSLLDVVSYVDVTNNSSGGLLVAAGNHEAGAISGSGSTSLVGGSLSAASFHQSSLSIGTGATARVRLNGTDNATSVLGALSLAGTPSSPSATFDLADNAAVIDYSGASPAGAVRQQIIAGRGGVGLGKGWNGIGITSSAAAAANTTNPESRSIGYAENDTLPLGVYSDFHGQPVDATSLLLAYTRNGDANLDGVVNDEDVTIVSATYAPGTAQASWALGDFDYNGFVDDDDITLLSAFYDPSAPPLIIGGTQLGTAPENVAAVPEPGSAVLAAIATLLAVFLRHNRRRTCRRC